MIVLVRHARTSGGTGRCIGQTPLPLSPAGVVQAHGLISTLGAVRFGRIVSSPAVRAMETVAPLALHLGLDVETLPGLDEIDMGLWEGQSFAVLKQTDAEAYEQRGRRFASFRPPGGESFADVAARALSVLESLPESTLPILAATHAGVIRSLLCRLTGHPLDDLFHFTPRHGWCCVLARADSGLQVLAESIAPDQVEEALN
ncbi:histidine phosphatase family protein [Pseudodesulfovibrio piezophilus]|uniref:Phosphoglycerate mutase n=1 Tax=Pseudodesulfovibrio piezophilus (strain DSM 21447 / JCM 15486 / C1TLV30) TaxID=1322246 RepID=M1WM73_PSEP2|nr:histidine phosphatase family protein [Pseudodesulfovibrio piezophilus]CCH49105.1 Phosphoglycerate mutase [Pseudodesulfovibrio piezophilus C1TLV30]